MKYLSHKFSDRGELLSYENDYIYLVNDDICDICSKSCAELIGGFNENFSSYCISDQIKFMNIVNKCLSEEEYIIKKLLE